MEDERFLDLKNLSFGLMAFKMALKVNSDLRFEFIGLFSLCKHDFFTPKAAYRLFVTFCGYSQQQGPDLIDLLW